ncbi:hypothetical protein [Streptomyces sp. NPDC056491]|uniref:hypothetical protein n=1 Tax=Streptomyces sp. NPDC056491 TaxID=3345837 RepID=UPI0036AFC80A
MRTRLLGFTTAVVLAVLGAAVPAAQAAAVPAVTGPTCIKGQGTVEYDSTTGLYTCIGGTYDTELITAK